ncbi:unnamed protein product [Gadus morhua 'NCC']
MRLRSRPELGLGTGLHPGGDQGCIHSLPVELQTSYLNKVAFTTGCRVGDLPWLLPHFVPLPLRLSVLALLSAYRGASSALTLPLKEVLLASVLWAPLRLGSCRPDADPGVVPAVGTLSGGRLCACALWWFARRFTLRIRRRISVLELRWSPRRRALHTGDTPRPEAAVAPHLRQARGLTCT